LDGAIQTWQVFRGYLQPVDARALQAGSPTLLSQIDAIVSQFETRARAKVDRLQWIQGIFFAAALLLLAWGYLLTRKRILLPLSILKQAAGQIAGGNLDRPLSGLEEDEFGELGLAFEAMRSEVAASRQVLESRVDQRTQELAAAFELSQEIVSQIDLDRLLGSVIERARALTGAQAASLCLLDQTGQSLVLVASDFAGDDGASSSTGRDSYLNLSQPLHRDPALRVIGAGQTITVEASCTSCGFLQAHSPGECAIAPLRAGATTLGALCVVRRPGSTFDPEETRAMTLLANSATVAISNARLIQDRQRQAEKTAALAERERLAADLHDNLAQTLSFVNLKIEQVLRMISSGRLAESQAEIGLMKSALDGAYLQLRAALVGLAEPEPVVDDLKQKLFACLAEFRQASGLPAVLIVSDPSALALPRLTQAQAVHIVREALANIRRHAQAGCVEVRVERSNGDTRFTIEDNGRGFDPQADLGISHLGLTIMQARAERSGGTLVIDSAPGLGTRVIASFPREGRRTIDG
jgi:two-component system nitrate/nitrite sensor histidine kinase NarX